MKEDYPLKGDTTKVQFTLEKDVIETLKKMSDYTKLSESEMVNTAVKRFIATHMDFLPPRKK
jgi:hypothetical protein